MKRDVFLCHASEDNQSVVRPLYAAFCASSISCWLDEAEVHWGDSIIEKVNTGLSDSRYVVVVLSVTSVTKSWPKRELASALSVEFSSGDVRVLPLLVGTSDQRKTILAQLPILTDKRYLTWEGNTKPVVEALRRRLENRESTGRERDIVQASDAGMAYCKRCGVATGTRTVCTGAYIHHEFVQGTGNDFCGRCGMAAGNRTICTGTYIHHEFVGGTGKDFCTRCGMAAGTRTTCTGTYIHHAFA